MNSLANLKSPTEIQEFYAQLTSRNHHFISAEVQEKLSQLKILIAGCGSTGGACIEALARAGVTQFWLADNGSFELTNLNRQHARMESLGKNKARFHAEEVKAINPYARVEFSESGIHLKNVSSYVDSVDLVFDAVDVTTKEGVMAKLLLHQACKQFKKPTLSGLDLGYLQWGCSYDYRLAKQKVLNGCERTLPHTENPIQALFQIFSQRILPAHAIPLVLDLLDGRSDFASQLGCTSDALSAIIVPAVLRFVEYGELISGWKMDSSKYRYSQKDRLLWAIKGIGLRRQLKRRLKSS